MVFLSVWEQFNAVLGKMVNKLFLDENNKYQIDVVVARLVSAKNAFLNWAKRGQNGSKVRFSNFMKN